MFEGSRGILLTIILVFVVSIAAMIGVVYSLFRSIEFIQLGKASALEPDREVEVLPDKYNYNFAVPEDKPQENESTPEEDDSNSEEKVEIETFPEYNYNFSIPEINTLSEMKSIQIPSIGYSSPIILTDNADTGIDYGAWYYPSNYPTEGESIFLCHRRYFQESDPKSCWNLDKVKPNDFLYLNFKNGDQFTYQVRSISVAAGDDISIYHSSDEQILKLISCAKEDGKIGSDSHRIVLIAYKVS